jgi:predicted aminopeptidase
MQMNERHRDGEDSGITGGETSLAPRRVPRLRARMVLGTVFATIGLAAAGFLSLTPLGRYVARAGFEEAKILSRRRLITEVIADPATSPELRGKLALVQGARQFAIDGLRLKAGNSFTQFAQLDRDTLVLVVSAAYRDRLELKTWWFPVVGRFPYKGFFNFGKARKTAEQLAREGFDVRVGPSSAFSTLGWFNDPLVSTTTRLDSVSLANTVIHEITHSTFFAKGHVSFNETFASFVGGRGAIAWFESQGDNVNAARAQAEWRDDLRLGAFWGSLAVELQAAFDSLPIDARDQRLAARSAIFESAKRRLIDSVAPTIETLPAGWADRVVLDNAIVLARRVYANRLDAFERVFEKEGRDLPRTIARIVELARSRPKDPLAAVIEAGEP